jgi:biopolymer transport protein ExbB/TolQ/ABC-type transporter Mla subunit MlaD
MATQDTQQVDFPAHERPHTEISTGVMLLVATGFTILWFVFLLLTPISKANFPRDLFLGSKSEQGVITKQYLIERVIFQGTITWVWALSIANIILKSRRIQKERAFIASVTLPEDMDMADTNRLVELYDRVKNNSHITESLGLTRVARVMAMWINTGDMERVAEYAREQADLDAAVSDSSFRRNRLFIWAMPLLGFVGTVYGVAAGISGFQAFLSGTNVTAETMKQQVGNITEGLAVAFYCTLLGLLTAGIAAFPSLMAERKEEEILGEIDELVEDRLLSRMPSSEAQRGFPVEEMVNAIRQGMEGMQTQSKFPIDELAQAIDAGFRRLPNPDRYEEVFSRAVSKAGDLINQKYDEFAQSYERRIGELGSQLGGKLEGVASSFNNGTQRIMSELTKTQERNLEVYSKNEQKLAEKFDELTEQLTTMAKEQSEQFGEAHESYVEAIRDLDKKEIARFEKMVQEFSQLATRLADSFKQAVSMLENASTRYSERMQQSVESLNEQFEKVTQLGTEIDKVLRTTQAMEATLRQVGSSDEFRQTLATLRSHLSTSDELLKQLSRPRKVIFQEARGEDGM